MARSAIGTNKERRAWGEDAAAALLLVVVLMFCFAPALGLPFRNADDFLHLDVAWALLAGETGSLGAIVRGYGRSDALRLVPWAVWTADAAIFGWTAAGYYATNIALQVALSLVVYGLARRLGAGPWGALAGGAWVGLNVATGQGVYFLGSRDDQCAVLLVVATVAAWPGLRHTKRGRWLGGALLAAACLSKPPAALALLLVLAVDSQVGPARSDRRTRAGLAAVVFAYGVGLAAVVGVGGLREMAISQPTRGSWTDPELLRRVAAMVAPGWSVRLPGRELYMQLAPAAVVVAAAALSTAARQGCARAARLAAIWLLVTLPAPLLWLSSRLEQGEDSGRQWLMPSVGLGLLVAAAVPRRRSWAVPVAVAIVAACAGRYSDNAGPFLDRPDPTVAQLLDAAGSRGEESLVVALQRPHAGVSALMTSGALRRAGGLKEPPRMMLQGADRLRTVRWEPLGYGALEPEGDAFSLGLHDGALVIDGPMGGAESFAILPAVDPGHPGAVLRSWRFDEAPGGWTAWPPRARSLDYVAHRGFRSRTERVLPEGQVGPVLRGGERPAALLSPELALDPHTVCGLRLDLQGAPRPPGWRAMGAEMVPGGVFSIMTWSEAADFSDGYQRSLTVPWGDVVRLDNAPAWRAEDWVRRIAIMPSNVPGAVLLRGVELLACEAS